MAKKKYVLCKYVLNVTNILLAFKILWPSLPKGGNTSIWGSLPNFSTGYFQVILDEVRSGQVRSDQVMTRDQRHLTSHLVRLGNIPVLVTLTSPYTAPPSRFGEDTAVYFNPGVACDRQVTRFWWYFITLLANSVPAWLPKPKLELWIDFIFIFVYATKYFELISLLQEVCMEMLVWHDWE